MCCTNILQANSLPVCTYKSKSLEIILIDVSIVKIPKKGNGGLLSFIRRLSSGGRLESL